MFSISRVERLIMKDTKKCIGWLKNMKIQHSGPLPTFVATIISHINDCDKVLIVSFCSASIREQSMTIWVRYINSFLNTHLFLFEIRLSYLEELIIMNWSLNQQRVLTLWYLNFFRGFSSHSLRQSLFVYWLIVATLKGIFTDGPL